jgi:hypothetical protein
MRDPTSIVQISGAGFSGTIARDLSGQNALGAGFRPLVHEKFPSQNIYRDDAVGLNFEHIFNGAEADRDISHATPRLDPRSVVSHSTSEASIVHRAEDSSWRIDSEMRYNLATPCSIDLTFSATLREDRYPLRYVALMWASYMNRARERRICFYGELEGREGWITLGDDAKEQPEGFETGTVSATGVPDLPYEQGAETLNIVEHPRKKFTRPFYYGLIDGDGDLDTRDDTMVYVVMFDQIEPIRFALWNFSCDTDGNRDPHSPAWDWQYVIRDPVVNRQYGYRARVIYKPFVGRADVVREFELWQSGLKSR